MDQSISQLLQYKHRLEEHIVSVQEEMRNVCAMQEQFMMTTDELQRSLEDGQRMLHIKDAEKFALQAELQRLRTQRDALETEIIECRTATEAHHLALHQKKAEIEAVRAELQEAQRRLLLAETNAALSDANDRIHNLQIEKNTLLEELGRVTQEVEAKRRSEEQLTRQVAQHEETIRELHERLRNDGAQHEREMKVVDRTLKNQRKMLRRKMDELEAQRRSGREKDELLESKDQELTQLRMANENLQHEFDQLKRNINATLQTLNTSTTLSIASSSESEEPASAASDNAVSPGGSSMDTLPADFATMPCSSSQMALPLLSQTAPNKRLLNETAVFEFLYSSSEEEDNESLPRSATPPPLKRRRRQAPAAVHFASATWEPHAAASATANIAAEPTIPERVTFGTTPGDSTTAAATSTTGSPVIPAPSRAAAATAIRRVARRRAH